jgi:hypothetical protein
MPSNPYHQDSTQFFLQIDGNTTAVDRRSSLAFATAAGQFKHQLFRSATGEGRSGNAARQERAAAILPDETTSVSSGNVRTVSGLHGAKQRPAEDSHQ